MYGRQLFVTLFLFVFGFCEIKCEAKPEFFPQIDTVHLPEIYVFAWKNQKDLKKFRRTVYNLKKVYPYSQVAKNKLIELDKKYRSFSSNKDWKVFVKQLEKELHAEFDAPLRKLTVSQGAMLIKLIDRETGKTTFSVLKEFRGGFSAFFWQGLAKLFGHNLKTKYDKNEDKILEELISMCENGTFDKLYYSMFAK